MIIIICILAQLVYLIFTILIFVLFLSIFVHRIKLACPELLDLFLQAPLFTPPIPSPDNNNDNDSSDSSDNTNNTPVNTPIAMAKLFNVPYLGKLPMDPNMMYACENGISFLEKFPNSSASKAFSDIVDKLILSTPDVITVEN